MDFSSSPVNTAPKEPISEPPTPTTGHISLLNDIGASTTSAPSTGNHSAFTGITTGTGTASIKPLLNMTPVLQQRSLPKSAYNHVSQYSITSSALSVKSIGSSIIDTDFENDNDGDPDVTSVHVPIAIAEAAAASSGGVSGANDEDEDNDDLLSTGKDDPHNHNNNHNHNHGNGNGNENTSNAQIMDFLSDFRNMTMSNMISVKDQHRRDIERLTTMLQNESNRRHAIEGRLHAQMLLQAETMVAMEVKLLRLESKVEKQQDGSKRKFTGIGGIGGGGSGSGSIGGGIAIGIGGGSTNSGNLGNAPAASANQHQHSQNHHPSGPSHYSNVEGRTGSIVANETIDEEEDFGMRNIKEIQVRTTNLSSGSHGHGHGHGNSASDRFMSSRSNTSRDRMQVNHPNPTNIIMSSGASLASGVTATSFLEDAHGVEDQHVDSGMHPRDVEDNNSARSNDGDVEDEGDGGDLDIIEDDGSASTPTQGGSRRDYRYGDIQPVTNLESILLNPIQSSGNNEHGMSTRAVRGDYDGNSSLATSMTNTTVTSTIVTATTKGNDSTRPLAHDNGSIIAESINEEVELAIANSTDLATSTTSREDYMLGLSPQTGGDDQHRPVLPRNESPLTVQSAATETRSVGQSVASASVAASIGTSIMSTAAVAPARSFRARRESAARLGSGNLVQDGRHWANRVVSFTSDQVFSVPPEISEAGDSITMPDELDNLSDVADEFANRARLWRDEYEARLDAIQKRWGAE